MISLLAPLIFVFLWFRQRTPVGRKRPLAILPGMAFLLLALGYDLGPSTSPIPTDGGGDILFCLDVSRSMLARDFPPDRLTKAKAAIHNILRQSPQDRFGLVAFAGSARLLAPLTRDRESLGEILDPVGPLFVDRGGTDFGQALSLALEALIPSEPKRSPCIVLLSDGEDFGGKGGKLAEQCKARGIPVFSVGLGTRFGSKIPILLGPGKETFLEDSKGNEVITRLHPEGLQGIAQKSGGSYLEGIDKNLQKLYAQTILGLRRNQRGSPHLGHALAFLGLLLLVFFIARSPGGRA